VSSATVKNAAGSSADKSRPGIMTRVSTILRRIPYTASVVIAMVVVGLLTEAFWRPLSDSDWWNRVAYGLPALEDGRWWTPITGSFFATIPLQYLPVLLGFAIMVGFCEYRLGTRTAALSSVGGQLAGVLGAAALLAIFKRTDWSWAIDRARELDVGFSAGALCALTVAAFSLRAPWRGRLLFLVLSYCVINLLWVGILWDIEHMIAVVLGIVLGLRVHGPRERQDRAHLSRHEWRLFATAAFVFVAAAQLIATLYPQNGPLGPLRHPPHMALLVVFIVLQVLVAAGLRRGSRLAWQIGMVVAVVGLVASLPLMPWPRAVAGVAIYALVLFILIRGRWAFTADIERGGSNRLIRDAAIILLAYAAYVVIGFAVIDRWQPQPSISMKLEEVGVRLIFETAGKFDGATRPARFFLDSLSVIPLLVILTFLVVMFFRVRRPKASQNRDAALRLLKQHGGTNVSWMTTWPDNAYFVTADGNASIAYRVHSGTAIALGDPTGAPDSRARAIREFAKFCEEHGYTPCLFSSSAAVLPQISELGWQAVQVAEDTVIDLPNLEFKGKAWQDIRTAINRAGKQGIVFRLGKLSDEAFGTVQQVRNISDQWVSDKGLPEMGFTLGGVEEALDPEVKVGLAVDGDGTVQGVTSWMPVYGGGGVITGWTLDVMRRLPDGFRPVVEFMIASACLAFKQEGAKTVSLSGAPLARSDSSEELRPIDTLLDTLGEMLEPLYGFRSLHQFKMKFKPRYEPLYLCYPDETALPRVGIALTRAYLPDAKLSDYAAMMKSTAAHG
jgi:phosphatidylglycerol lysyltransferase